MIIKVKVKPGNSKEEIVKGDIWTVFVEERPENSKASEAVRKLLSNEFNVGEDKIIIKTSKRRLKLVEVKK